jgi:hypothetical protein
MANLRNKLFGLAGVGLAFAGMAYGQIVVTCGMAGGTAAQNGSSPNANTIRAEGQTEMVGNLVFQCTNTSMAAVALNLQVFVSPSPLTITSKALDTAVPADTEAQALITAAGVAPANGTYGVPGTLGSGGTSLNFSLSLPVGGNAAQTITITNVRVNAAALASASVTPIYETAYIAGGATVASFTSNQTQVSLAEPGIAGVTISSAAAAPLKAVGNVAVCTGIGADTTAGHTNLANATFYINFQEGFGNAFKNANNSTSGGAGTTNTTSATTNNTETNLYIQTQANAGGGGAYAASFITGGNLATTNTRIQVVFSNVPTGVSLYVPQTITSSAAYGAGNTAETFSLTASATAGYGAITPISNSTDLPQNNDVLLTGTGGTIIAVYDYQTPAANVALAAAAATVSGIFQIPVVERFAPNAVVSSAPALSAVLSFAPISAQATNVPSFIVTSSSPTLAAGGFTACSTTLIFPYATNSAGFDLGIAIANTSSDNLGKVSSTNPTGTSASNTSGTCAMNFYGSGGTINAGTAAGIPVPLTGSATTPWPGLTGTNTAFTLSSVNPGFTGYIIVQCQFLYAHGYAYVFTNYGTPSGTTASYLPLVVGSTSGSRAATPETLMH